MQAVLKYYFILLLIFGSLIGRPIGITILNSIFNIVTPTVATHQSNSANEVKSHDHAEHRELPGETDCAHQKCHVCHSSHCSMELCVAENFTNQDSLLFAAGYQFNYSYLYFKVLKRPPINV